MEAYELRRVLAHLHRFALDVLSQTAEIKHLAVDRRKELRKRLRQAPGNPLSVFRSRVEYLQEVVAVSLEDGEFDLDYGIVLLASQSELMKEIASALPLILETESRECAELCSRLEGLMKVAQNAVDRFEEAEKETAEPPFEFTTKTFLLWGNEAPLWSGVARLSSSATEQLLVICRRKARAPAVRKVRRALERYVDLHDHGEANDDSDAGLDYFQAADEFDGLIIEQDDTLAAMLVFLSNLADELQIQAIELDSHRSEIISDSLELFEAYKRPPVVSAIEHLELVLDLLPLYLPPTRHSDRDATVIGVLETCLRGLKS